MTLLVSLVPQRLFTEVVAIKGCTCAYNFSVSRLLPDKAGGLYPKVDEYPSLHFCANVTVFLSSRCEPSRGEEQDERKSSDSKVRVASVSDLSFVVVSFGRPGRIRYLSV